MSSREDDRLFDPFMLPQYLQLNDAIEQFTADMAKQDPNAFRRGGADLRHVVERYLFFALFADRKLYEYFVACKTGRTLPDEGELSIWSRQIAPYFRGQCPRFEHPQNLKSRFLRLFYKLYGHASISTANCGVARPQVLFLVIHLKFVRYLSPIAERLHVPYAFLVIDDPEMFEALGEQNLPRIHIELTADSLAMTRTEVSIFGLKFRPGLFDSWIIRLNAVRRALKQLACTCVVVPEGNAAIYELVNQSARTIDIPTLCVQQGWAPVVHPGFRNMSYTRMCVWGDEFAKLLAPCNPKQRFVAAGNHVVGCQPQGDVRRRRAVAFFLQNGAHWITEAAWRSMLNFIMWAAQTFPDFEIRVREHPGEPLRDEDVARALMMTNVTLMPPNEFSLSDVLSDCRVAVAINSTTLLEAAASGVVPLILDVSGFGPYHPDIAGDGAAVEVTNFVDARTELARLVSDDRHCASFAGSLEKVRRGLFRQHGDQALNAITAEIKELGGLGASRSGDKMESGASA